MLSSELSHSNIRIQLAHKIAVNAGKQLLLPFLGVPDAYHLRFCLCPLHVIPSPW